MGIGLTICFIKCGAVLRPAPLTYGVGSTDMDNPWYAYVIGVILFYFFIHLFVLSIYLWKLKRDLRSKGFIVTIQKDRSYRITPGPGWSVAATYHLERDGAERDVHFLHKTFRPWIIEPQDPVLVATDSLRQE